MKHLGDISKLNGAEVEPVDVITFGSPCQDLSVAGKRAGLEGARSGLFMEAVRIIKEMREATNGQYPTFALWENVPGAFSSNKGEDFRIVLEELIKIAEPGAAMPEVPPFGWAYADSYSGDGWSLAYRVFDAQYWGVPQRRRRIHLVADFRGQRAREVLFERKGLRGHLTESPAPRERITAYVEVGPGATDQIMTYAVATQQGGAEISDNGICPTVTAAAGMSGNNQPWICTPTAYGISSYDSNAMKSANPNSGIYEAETSRTLDLNGGNPACNQGGIAIVQPVAFTQNQRDELRTLGDKAGCLQAEPGMKQQTFIIDSIGGQAERGWEGDIAPTLKASHYKFPPVITKSAGFCTEHSAKAGGGGFQDEAAPTLRAGTVPAAVFENHSQDTRYKGPVDVSQPLSATFGMGGNNQPFVVSTNSYATDVGFFNTQEELSPTLLARMYKDPHLITYPDESVRYIVRRLTPTECARLQGFSDKWGHPDPKEDFTEDEYQFWMEVRNTHAAINGKTVKEYPKEQMLKWYNKLHSDSAEYKMWGNGIALPPALYCMQGISNALEECTSNEG